MGSAASRYAAVRRRARALAVALILTWIATAPSALAQIVEVVRLKDGSVYQGKLVEKVQGERIVIQLATGEIKTFTWDDIVSPTPPPAPPTPRFGDDANLGIPPNPGYAPVPPPHEYSAAGPWLYLGGVTSLPQFGSPRGIIGVAAEFKTFRWLGIEVTGGYDGPIEVAEGDLGWSVAETVRFGDQWGLGAGVSQHFGARGTGTLNMAHGEFFFNLDLGTPVSSSLVIRMATGLTTMLNGGSHAGACGFFNVAGGNTDDNGNPTDTSCAVFYFDVEVFFRLPLGKTADTQ